MSTSNDAKLTREFARLFRGRRDAWGSLPPKCNHEQINLAHYSRHLAGRVSLGIYPLLDDGTCFWAAADFDQEKPARWHSGRNDASPALSLMESLGHFGLNQGVCLEKTKGKGWRIWAFFSNAVPARNVRKLLFAALERAGLPTSIEVFPKQDFLAEPTPENPDPVGNFVHLPNFGGGPSGQRPGRVFVDPKTLAPITLAEMIGCVRAFPADALPLVLENLHLETSAGRPAPTPEHIAAMLSKPLAVGERRPTLVKLAGYLRYRGIPEQVALALLIPWAEKAFSEPLPPAEVEQHVRGIYRRYGLTQPRGGEIARRGTPFFAEVEL
ncbi:MAG: hypothetical protein DDT36_01685 [Firmicutes bacterium]|nr:hypothetical protein [Bacillota bacterium]